MADLSAVQAYQATLRAALDTAADPSKASDANKVDFGNLVSTALQDTSAALKSAEQMTAAGAMGDAELIDVVTAVSAAELQLESVVAVRDEVVRAYQEILRMPI